MLILFYSIFVAIHNIFQQSKLQYIATYTKNIKIKEQNKNMLKKHSYLNAILYRVLIRDTNDFRLT